MIQLMTRSIPKEFKTIKINILYRKIRVMMINNINRSMFKKMPIIKIIFFIKISKIFCRTIKI